MKKKRLNQTYIQKVQPNLSFQNSDLDISQHQVLSAQKTFMSQSSSSQISTTNSSSNTINTDSKIPCPNTNTNNLGSSPNSSIHDISYLSRVRVIKKNLVYVIGIAPQLANYQTLSSFPYFGQYGEIQKLVVNKNTIYNPKGPNGPSFSAYITYTEEKDASLAILGAENFKIQDRIIRASYGTTKYCSYFLKNEDCPNIPDCLYLHSYFKDDHQFSKDEMVSNKNIFMDQQKIAIKNIRNYIPNILTEYAQKRYFYEMQKQFFALPNISTILEKLRDYDAITVEQFITCKQSQPYSQINQINHLQGIYHQYQRGQGQQSISPLHPYNGAIVPIQNDNQLHSPLARDSSHIQPYSHFGEVVPQSCPQYIQLQTQIRGIEGIKNRYADVHSQGNGSSNESKSLNSPFILLPHYSASYLHHSYSPMPIDPNNLQQRYNPICDSSPQNFQNNNSLPQISPFEINDKCLYNIDLPQGLLQVFKKDKQQDLDEQLSNNNEKKSNKAKEWTNKNKDLLDFENSETTPQQKYQQNQKDQPNNLEKKTEINRIEFSNFIKEAVKQKTEKKQNGLQNHFQKSEFGVSCLDSVLDKIGIENCISQESGKLLAIGETIQNTSQIVKEDIYLPLDIQQKQSIVIDNLITDLSSKSYSSFNSSQSFENNEEGLTKITTDSNYNCVSQQLPEVIPGFSKIDRNQPKSKADSKIQINNMKYELIANFWDKQNTNAADTQLLVKQQTYLIENNKYDENESNEESLTEQKEIEDKKKKLFYTYESEQNSFQELCSCFNAFVQTKLH